MDRECLKSSCFIPFTICNVYTSLADNPTLSISLRPHETYHYIALISVTNHATGCCKFKIVFRDIQ